MIFFLTAVVIGLLAILIKMIVDVYMLIITVRKDQEVVAKPHPTDEGHQFIKGLY
ncbi:hypothetical protein BDD43_4378 [Mucilaginibacter gracilis]|uniref:Uncharacterized protein n=1 Tax=Mucilaginibacter gracilis TaxID=423350 RepID=A0A495J604_9SPHI|nr:hypothetical protein [Mucilaginibacter gracilis]RKR84151.1 hypothetical protein BDD43_4378 [Mucilaginibacter gracilis]